MLEAAAADGGSSRRRDGRGRRIGRGEEDGGGGDDRERARTCVREEKGRRVGNAIDRARPHALCTLTTAGEQGRRFASGT